MVKFWSNQYKINTAVSWTIYDAEIEIAYFFNIAPDCLVLPLGNRYRKSKLMPYLKNCTWNQAIFPSDNKLLIRKARVATAN